MKIEKLIKKSKLLALLAALLMLGMLCNVAFAANEPAVILSSVQGAPGDEVQVTVGLQNNPGIIATELKVAYDSDKLVLKKAETGSLMEDPGVFGDKLIANPYYLSWDDYTRRDNMAADGVLATLTFEIKEACSAGDVAAVSVRSVKAHNTELKDVQFATVAGSVTVTGDDTGLGDTPTLLVSNAKGKPGEEVTVTVTMKNNPGIMAMLLDLKYDASQLELTKVADSELLPNFVGSETLNTNPYVLFWEDSTATENHCENGKLATLTFKILDGADVGSTPITLNYDPDDIFNTAFETVAFTAKAGAVTVEGTGDSGTGGGGSGGGGGGGTSTGQLDVSFRLIGCTQADSAVDFSEGVPAGLHGAEYQTWIKTTKYSVDKGTTVADLFEQALQKAGLSWRGSSSWVSAITAPAALGGYELAQLDNGPNSGWMYTVNGKHLSKSMDEYVLKSGDKVIWHYINDYNYEQEDWAGGSLSGNKDTFNLWLKASDSVPSGSSGSSGGGGGGSAVSTTVNPVVVPDANGEAKVGLTTSEVRVIVSEAKEAGADKVVLAPKISGSATKVTVSIPLIAARSVGKDANADLCIKTDIAVITIGRDDLSKLGTNGNLTVSAARDGDAVSITVLADGKDISLIDSTVELIKQGAAHTDVLMQPDADGNWQIIKKCAPGDVGVVAALDGSTRLKLAANALTFADISKHWGKQAAEFVAARGIFNGTSATTFAPNDKMSRAMVATVLWRLQNEPAVAGQYLFKDSVDSWARDAVIWAAAQNIVTGDEAGCFNGSAAVTRQELAAMLYRYAKAIGMDTTASGSLSGFADSAAVADWATDAMRWMVGSGLIKGNADGTINPGGTATRAEVATVIMRLIEMSVR